MTVFENRMTWTIRVYGPKAEEVTGGWRNLYNDELWTLYSNIPPKGYERPRACMRFMRNAHKDLVGEHGRERPLCTSKLDRRIVLRCNITHRVDWCGVGLSQDRYALLWKQ
jgi:hypothetical protein